MKVYTAYPERIKECDTAFDATAEWYRKAVDFFTDVIMENWQDISALPGRDKRVSAVERLTVRTPKRPEVPYDFGKDFYKFPSYLRRAAIAEALGNVSSYQSLLDNWKKADTKTRGKKPGYPKAGKTFPMMYRKGCYKETGDYTAEIKVFRNNTWDWTEVKLRKSDVDYIQKHCCNRRECPPKLVKRGKKWSLVFSYEEEVTLTEKPPAEQIIVAVDLGINSACVCSVMKSDGTVVGRRFLQLPAENDSLEHKLGKIRRAQKHGAKKMPALWANVKGTNEDISVKTAQFIINVAHDCGADVIVMEKLDKRGKKRRSKKQRLHHWRSQYVQAMVVNKAHRLGMHVSHVCARNTSRLAYDGSGKVLRGEEAELKSHSMCKFQTGKVYNCDLNATYNIGARYFIRELLKSLPETEKQGIEAKVPQCLKRSTCTLSDLISLNAVLADSESDRY